LTEMKGIVWRNCVLCGRCYCPIGIHIPSMIACEDLRSRMFILSLMRVSWKRIILKEIFEGERV
jgi:hypothetical protein